MMVALGFDMKAYQYEQGLKALKLMWVAGSQAITARSKEVLADIAEYERYLEDGGVPIGEWDGEDLLVDQSGYLRLELVALQEALVELNRATVISIYHHWERHVPSDVGETKRQHSKLVADSRSARIGVHADIDALHFAGNFLKHGNLEWLEKLSVRFPHRFPNLAKIKKSIPAWWGTLQVDDEHIEWFFEIATTSKRTVLISR